MTDVEERLKALEDIVSGLKEVPNDIFETLDENDDTCDEELENGEVCGRELPCRYHSGDE